MKPRMWERKGVQPQLAPTLAEILLLPLAFQKKKGTEESCTLCLKTSTQNLHQRQEPQPGNLECHEDDFPPLLLPCQRTPSPPSPSNTLLKSKIPFSLPLASQPPQPHQPIDEKSLTLVPLLVVFSFSFSSLFLSVSTSLSLFRVCFLPFFPHWKTRTRPSIRSCCEKLCTFSLS